jgi:hypothetical protein
MQQLLFLSDIINIFRVTRTTTYVITNGGDIFEAVAVVRNNCKQSFF